MASAAGSLSSSVLSRVLEDLVEGTRSVSGVDFMRSLVRSLAHTPGVRFAMLARVADAEFTRVARAARDHGVSTELLEFEVEAARALRSHDVNPRLLEFELTESALMSHAQGNIAALLRLKALGVTIAVDDFGTGYSSLAYLKRFPIDTVKIDIAFIRDVTTNPDDAAITLAIIAMAHSLKLKVIAEGVETREQLEFLRANGCDEMQGYYLSRPLPPAELEAFYRQSGSHR